MSQLNQFLFVAIALILPYGVSAQFLWNEHTQLIGDHNMAVEAIGEGYSNSNALTNAFFFGFVNGRFVNESEKDIMLNRSARTNRFGQDATYGLRFTHKLGDESFIQQWHVGIAERFHIDGRLSDEALELALYGNKRFAGETVDLNDINLRFQRWKELQLGAQKRLNENWVVGAQAAWLLGDQNVDFATETANLYTAPLGNELQVSGDFFLHQSDTNKLGPHALNGMGASIGLWAQRSFTLFDKAKSGYVQVAASDIGAIWWNKESVRYDGDTLYVFEGVLVDRILDFEDEDIDVIDGDSLINIFAPDAENGSYTTLVPINIEARIVQVFETFEASAGIRYRTSASYFPQLFTSGYYYLSNWKLGGTMAFGGYAPFELGIGAQYTLKDQWSFSLGTRNLEGLIAWKRFGGSSAYVQIGYFF